MFDMLHKQSHCSFMVHAEGGLSMGVTSKTVTKVSGTQKVSYNSGWLMHRCNDTMGQVFLIQMLLHDCSFSNLLPM